MKLLKFYFFILTTLSLQAKSPKIFEISIPKCGTYLLARCIRLLVGNLASVVLPNHFILTSNDIAKIERLMPHQFIITHLFYSEQYLDYLSRPDFLNIFIYRDPRDQLISLAFYMKADKKAWPLAHTLTFDELVLDLMTTGSSFEDKPPVRNVTQLYENYLNWLNVPEVLSVRFEDLVGEKGGGSKEQQISTMKKIATHLKLKVSNSRIATSCDRIYGNTPTFREGKIGSWKNYFKPYHIDAFKQTAGELLIKLGYEKDLSW